MTGKSPPVTTSITSPPATLTKIMSNILSLERQNIRKWGEYSVIFGSENDRIFPSFSNILSPERQNIRHDFGQSRRRKTERDLLAVVEPAEVD